MKHHPKRKNQKIFFIGSLSLIGLVFILGACASTQQLGQAVKEGNQKRVQKYLRGIDPDKALNGWGESALHLAVSRPWPEITLTVLEAAPDIHKKDRDGNTPLAKAAFWGNTEAAEILLTQGADISEVNKRGQNPLWLAASRGQVETLSLLLSRGADKNHRGLMAPYGSVTPFTAALLGGYGETARILLQEGADPALPALNSELADEPLSPLSACIHAGRAESVALLLDTEYGRAQVFSPESREVLLAREKGNPLIESLLLRQRGIFHPGSAEEFIRRRQGSFSLAILPPQGDFSPETGFYLESSLGPLLQKNPQVTLVSRGALELIFQEIGFQLSGLTSENGPDISELGQLSPADYILHLSYIPPDEEEGFLELGIVSATDGTLVARSFRRVTQPAVVKKALEAALKECGLL